MQIWHMEPFPCGDRRLPHHVFPPKKMSPDQLLTLTGVMYYKVCPENSCNSGTKWPGKFSRRWRCKLSRRGGFIRYSRSCPSRRVKTALELVLELQLLPSGTMTFSENAVWYRGILDASGTLALPLSTRIDPYSPLNYCRIKRTSSIQHTSSNRRN